MTEATEGAQTPEQISQESGAAFASGFDTVRGTEAPATPAAPAAEPTKPAPSSTESAAPVATEAAPAKPVVDEWAGVPSKVKAELDSLRDALSSVTKIPDRLRTVEGHIGGLKTLTEDLKAALAQARTAVETKGKETPTTDQVSAAIKDPERWKRLKEDYPDWADAIEPELADIRQQLDKLGKATPPAVDTAALKTEVSADVDKRILASTQLSEARVRNYAYLDFKHGLGWEKNINTPDFEAWYAKQPKDVQALSASHDVADASKMIGLYEAQQKSASVADERKKRLERAITPTGVPAVPASHEDPEAAFSAGFEKTRAGG